MHYVAGTQKANDVFDRHIELNKLDRGRFKNMFAPGDVTLGAEAIVKATYSRQRELYHPSNQNLFLSVLLSRLMPSWLESEMNRPNLTPQELEQLVLK